MMRTMVLSAVVLLTIVTMAVGAAYEDGASQWHGPLSHYVVVIRSPF